MNLNGTLNMIKIENRIRIRTSRSDVYKFLLNFRNIPKWNYYVKKVIPVDSKANHEFFHQIRKNDEQDFEVVELIQNEKIVIRTLRGSGISFTREFVLRKVAEAECTVQDRFELDTGHPGFLQALFKNKVKNAVKKNLTKLKELLENGKTQLQDGRVQII
jgi:uncharacterized membrane protein